MSRMSYTYASPVLAIIRRRKFNRSSRSKPPRLRYAAIELRLYYDCAVPAPHLNFTARRIGERLRFVIMRRANGYGADLDAMFAAR